MKNNTTPANSPDLEDQEMYSVLCAREDVFRLALETHCYLSAPMPPAMRAERLRYYLEILQLSTESRLIDRLITEEHGQFPAYICTGPEADWQWYRDRLLDARRMPPERGVRHVLSVCADLLNSCQPGVPCDPNKAQEILGDLEQRFGFLTRCVGPKGVFAVYFPSFSASHDTIDFSYSSSFLNGPESRLVMLASADGVEPVESGRSLYEACVYTLVNHECWEDLPSEEALLLLKNTIAPDVVSMDQEDQINSYLDGLLMGLSYGGKHVDFEICPDATEEDRRCWRDYAETLIRKIGKEVR